VVVPACWIGPECLPICPTEGQLGRSTTFSPARLQAASLIHRIPTRSIHTPLTMADLNLREIHDFMITIAKQAGARITSAKPSTSSSGSKKNCLPRPSTTPREPN
jgi:hypothetical protein